MKSKIGNLNLNIHGRVQYLSAPCFEKFKNLKHCFTTRIGGVSLEPFNSLNLGINTQDKDENVIENYKIISDSLNINVNDIVISNQVHKDDILIVDESYKGNHFFLDRKVKNIDALITNKKNIAIVTLYADCVPIMIYDKGKNIIALAHAGWRGTVKKIGKKVLKKLKEEFNSNMEDCIALIGPSIGKCCFEVDEPVVNEFKKVFEKEYLNFTTSTSNDKYMIDLWEANKISLLEAGLPEANIIISNICTKCNNDILYSYRNENGNTGRMAAIMQLV